MSCLKSRNLVKEGRIEQVVEKGEYEGLLLV
jgi:hypothetical protein